MEYDIESNVDSLATVLCWGQFITPYYQRPYAWEPENVKHLLEDVDKCISGGKPHHFLGTLMFVPLSDDKLEIIDGQQRIATFMLICAYLCKSLKESGHSSNEGKVMRVAFVLNEMHNKTMEHATQLNLRVMLSENDNITYESLMRGEISANGKLGAVWETMESFFSRPEYNKPEKQDEFLLFFLQKLKVAWVKFQSSDDSVTAFETQNTRGAPLNQIQLVCAYFFARLRDSATKSKTVNDRINKIRANFNGRDSEGKFLTYTRCMAQCMYGYLPKDTFSRHLKDHLDTEEKVYNFVKQLATPAKIEIFNNILQGRWDQEDFGKLATNAGMNRSKKDISTWLKDLNKHKSVSITVLFSLMCQYHDNLGSSPIKKKKVAKFTCQSIKLMASFFQRASHSFTGSFKPSVYEQNAANLAVKIHNREVKDAPEFLKALASFDKNKDIIENAPYIERMKQASFTTKAKVKVAGDILIRINDKKQPGLSYKDITAEHVLPKSTNYKEWGFKIDDHNVYAHRLGNFALCPPDDILSTLEYNANFKAKQAFYAKSTYDITKKLKDVKKWDVNAIEERQKELAKDAAKVWNFKI